MSNKNSIIVDENGEVLDQSSLVPTGDGNSLRELIPYNRMTNIAKSTLTRVTWDKKKGVWSCALGQFDSLILKPMAASELYAVWSDQVGKPLYYGVSEDDALRVGVPEVGRRVAFLEETIGPAYCDFFGMTVPFADALCKIGTASKDTAITVKGSDAIPTSNGVFHTPKIVR